MTKPRYKIWDPRAVCDCCGFSFYMSDLRPQYVRDSKIGMYCLPNSCWNPPHPLDWPPPVIPDGRPVYNARPEPADEFIVVATGLSVWGGSWISLNNGTVSDPTWDELTDNWDNY